MKAVVKVAPGSGHMADTHHPDPEVRPGQVRIEVRAAGVGGPDISPHNSTESMVREYRPHPPLVMGHEVFGSCVRGGDWRDLFQGRGPGDGQPHHVLRDDDHVRQAGQPSICDCRPQLGRTQRLLRQMLVVIARGD